MKRRCFDCRKKVPFGIPSCNICEQLYCSRHRLPFEHNCNSTSEQWKESIRKNNPKVVSQKIVKI